VTRVAVIGAGWWAAAHHIPNLVAIPGVVLDGVCRLGPAELEAVRAQFGFAFASEDPDAVLARRPEAVVVSSPHALHHAHAASALEAGAHVLVEKPMTLDPAEARDLVARARRAGRQIIVGNGYHWCAGLDAVRARLAAAAIGRIEHAMCSFVSATRNVFVGEDGMEAWRSTMFRPALSTWQNPAAGGGFTWGQMSHSVALLLWLTGLRPLRASAAMLGATVDLTVAGTLACEGGATVALSGAAAWPEGRAALLRLVVTGDRGTLDLAVDEGRAVIRRLDGSTEDFSPSPGAWRYSTAGPIHALVAAARGDVSANHAPGEIGAATVAVLAALHGSAEAGGAMVSVAA